MTSLAGVSEAIVEVGSATVTYDEAKLNKYGIESAIKKAGYKISAS